MLVLTRKVNESIFIGDEVELVLIEVRGNRVRLGIRAPKEIPVRRAEVTPAEGVEIEIVNIENGQ